MTNVVKKHSISDELAQKMVNEAVAKATHQTAPTQFVDANGIRFAYRRFAIPAACRFVQPALHRHYGLLGSGRNRRPGQEREVILFNNAGVASSSGQVPTSVQEMAATPSPSLRL